MALNEFLNEGTPQETTLGNAQKVVREFDEQFWEHSDPSHSPDGVYIRHVEHHVVKTAGRLATWTEAWEHYLTGGKLPTTETLTKEVIPDLIDLGLRLANALGEDAALLLQDRLRRNVARSTSGDDPRFNKND
jgi:hypothetical protein